MENIMSSNDIENETQSHMDAMLQAIQYKNLSQSRAHFDNLMQDKISDALEAEKVNIASQVYNAQPEEDEEFESDHDDSEYDVESELEDAFDESEYEEDEVEV
jgi:hypothetical protein